MKTHIKKTDIPVELVSPGITRQVLCYDTNLMLVVVKFEKGVVATRHKHPHQQATYVEKGAFEVEIDGKVELLKQGDGYFIPSNAMHGAKCIEEGVLIDTFSPMREDFV